MKCILSFDYELFFGPETGSVFKCMIEPTNRLLDLAERFAIPMVFFVDAGFLWQLKAHQEQYPALKGDFDAISQQIERMKRLSCDIQLHVHPHWEQSFYDGQKWNVNTDGCYKLADFSDEEAKAIVLKYGRFLTDLTGIQLTTYRAGGWCIQPFNQIATALSELGITVDSSVFPGGQFESPHYDFDFSTVPPFSKTYTFESDVCVQTDSGSFVEVPISSWRYSPLFYWELYIKGRLNRAAHKMWGDGMFLAQPGRKKSVLTNYTWNHVSCDGYYARLLPVQFNRYLRMNHDAFVVIGHPKGLTHFALERLELFIPWVKNKAKFSTYESFVCK